MRSFIAIPLPQSIKDYLSDIQDQVKKCNVNAKWVNTKNTHMTLKFLGEVQEDRIPSIESAIKETIAGISSIVVNLIGFGFFPNEHNPRVFFVSTDKEEILQKIAHNMEDKLRPLGFNPDHRFKSHITLARIKNKKNTACLFSRSKEIKVNKSFYVNSIILYKSTLTPHGPIYEELFSAKF